MDEYVTPSAAAILGLVVGYAAALARHDAIGAPDAKGVLSSPSAVLKWLGGPIGAAAWAGVGAEMIKGWFEEIPTGYQHRLYLKARSEGYTITPGAFGLKRDGTAYYPLPALENRQKAAAP